MKTYYYKSPFGGIEEVYISVSKYKGGANTCLNLICVEDGISYSRVTINVPGEKLLENELIIKNYSENEGMLLFLQKNGIVGNVKRFVSSGFIKLPVVELLKPLNEL